MDTVTWEAIHVGLRMRLSSRITEFDPPHRFVLGRLADRLFVRRYMERLLRDRNAFIKLVAERGE